jgi:hypothetical protein
MIIDYLQDALHSFNLDTPNWYGWRTHDDNGNKIPSNERMCWEHVIVIKEGAIKPTKQQLEDRIKELKNKYEVKEYEKKRIAEYGSVAKQIEYITENGLDAWQSKVAEIKLKYPKENN